MRFRFTKCFRVVIPENAKGQVSIDFENWALVWSEDTS